MLLHLGQLLQLGLQQTPGHIRPRSSPPPPPGQFRFWFRFRSQVKIASGHLAPKVSFVSGRLASLQTRLRLSRPQKFSFIPGRLAPKSSVSSQVVSPLVKFASGRLGQSANFSFGAQLNVIS